MTAKQALLERVEGMSEADAEYVLEWLNRPPVRPFPRPSEMIKMSAEEIDAIFARYPPETDMDDVDWIAGLDPDSEEYRHLDDPR